MPELTMREQAIEAMMAVAALASGSAAAQESGQSRTVITGAIKALAMLGVTDKELATVTVKSRLIDTDSNGPESSFLRHFAGL